MQPSSLRPLILEVRTVTGTGGGPEKTILLEARWLQARAWPVQVVYLHPPGDSEFEVIRARAEKLGVFIDDLADRGPLDFHVVGQLWRRCQGAEQIIWHGHDYKADCVGWLMRRVAPIKLLSTVHGWGVYGPRVRVYHFLHKLCLRGFDRVLCVAESLREECVRAGIPPRICEVLPNGVDCEEFSPPDCREHAKRALNLALSHHVIGYVGRLSPEKDLGSFVRAVKRLLEWGQPVHGLIVGDGPTGQELRNLLRESSLEKHITLAGHAADPRPFYAAMDVFVLPSLREGLPNVLLEAMAMALPIVATPVGGIPQLIHDGQTGLLVSPQDDKSLAEAVARLLANPHWAQTLGENARIHVKTHYSFARRMEHLENVIERLLSSR